MAQQQAFQHMVAWAIQNLINCYKEAGAILADESLSEEEKKAKLQGPNGVDHRMLNYVLLLKPALEDAEKEFPDHTSFFEWFKERWDYIEGLKILNGPCQCKGCKVDDKIDTNEKPAQ
jgi:hypothetical protein